MGLMKKTEICTLSAVPMSHRDGIALGQYFGFRDKNNPLGYPGTLFFCSLVYDESQKKNVLTVFPDACKKWDVPIKFKDDEVTINCYGEKKMMEREQAKAYYADAVLNSDGSEKARYANILAQICLGSKECFDV